MVKLKRIKNAFLSSAYSLVSLSHCFFNLFQKDVFSQDTFYFSYKNNSVLDPIRRELGGLLSHSLTIYDMRSFLERGRLKGFIHFNNILSRPFLSVCFSDASFRKRFDKYLYMNYFLFLQRYKPKRVIMIDETSAPHSALTLAANRLGIVSIALQHGAMYSKDESFRMHKGYAEYKRRLDKDSVVDYCIVYSKREQEFLIRGSNFFNKRNVLGLGCPRYDFLATVDVAGARDDVLRRFSLAEKPIVLWTTQTHGLSKTENVKNCGLLFSFFGEHRDSFNFLIKLHHNEDQSAPLYNYWNRKYGGVATIIDAGEDLYSLLKASDLLLVKTSSTASEALLMDKLVFFLDLEKNNDTAYYRDYGFPWVESRKDFEHFMSKMGFSKFKKDFSSLRDRFIRDNFNNFGSATEKVVSFIKEAKKNE